MQDDILDISVARAGLPSSLSSDFLDRVVELLAPYGYVLETQARTWKDFGGNERVGFVLSKADVERHVTVDFTLVSGAVSIWVGNADQKFELRDYAQRANDPRVPGFDKRSSVAEYYAEYLDYVATRFHGPLRDIVEGRAWRHYASNWWRD